MMTAWVRPRAPSSGVLLALAGRQFLRTATAQRRWAVALLAGIVLTDVFGVAVSAAHLRVAVS
jgi:hypothetical protein